jgi:multiple sugar transport system permease protein
MRVKASKKWFALGYLLPSLAGVAVFFIVPYVKIIYYAMVDNPVSNNYVGFDNFIKLMSNTAFKTAVCNTISFSVIAVPLAVVLSLLLAMALNSKIPGESKFRTFFLSPMMVPAASIVLIWQAVFDDNGALNGLLGVIGISPIDWMKSDYSHYPLVFMEEPGLQHDSFHVGTGQCAPAAA